MKGKKLTAKKTHKNYCFFCFFWKLIITIISNFPALCSIIFGTLITYIWRKRLNILLKNQIYVLIMRLLLLINENEMYILSISRVKKKYFFHKLFMFYYFLINKNNFIMKQFASNSIARHLQASIFFPHSTNHFIIIYFSLLLAFFVFHVFWQNHRNISFYRKTLIGKNIFFIVFG